MSKSENYIDYDPIGENTLTVISKADKFNLWMYSTIKPYIKGKVLEIGSGIGNISKFVLEDNFKITLSDIRPHYCSSLENIFQNHPSFLGTITMDLTDPYFDEKFAPYLNEYDTIFALNVVEHIKNDSLALKNCKKLLKNGGHLIILVPSYMSLYNNFDRGLGHYRRYTINTLKPVFLENGFTLKKKRYFNFIGIFGWYFSGNILKRKEIPGGQMKLFNKLVPIFKFIDIILFYKFGLSTIIVGKK